MVNCLEFRRTTVTEGGHATETEYASTDMQYATIDILSETVFSTEFDVETATEKSYVTETVDLSITQTVKIVDFSTAVVSKFSTHIETDYQFSDSTSTTTATRTLVTDPTIFSATIIPRKQRRQEYQIPQNSTQYHSNNGSYVNPYAAKPKPYVVPDNSGQYVEYPQFIPATYAATDLMSACSCLTYTARLVYETETAAPIYDYVTVTAYVTPVTVQETYAITSTSTSADLTVTDTVTIIDESTTTETDVETKTTTKLHGIESYETIAVTHTLIETFATYSTITLTEPRAKTTTTSLVFVLESGSQLSTFSRPITIDPATISSHNTDTSTFTKPITLDPASISTPPASATVTSTSTKPITIDPVTILTQGPPPLVTPRPTTTTSTIPAAVPTSTLIVANCYAEPTSGAKALPNRNYNDQMTPQLCIEICAAGNYLLAAVEYSSECWCGDVLAAGTQSADMSFCTDPCSGDQNQMCGGNNYFNLYETA